MASCDGIDVVTMPFRSMTNRAHQTGDDNCKKKGMYYIHKIRKMTSHDGIVVKTTTPFRPIVNRTHQMGIN